MSTPVDFTIWDWLPRAASEIEQYLVRLLAEENVIPHSVSARAKTIDSFQKKCQRKQYTDPLAEVTDAVGVRIITHSIADQQMAAELILGRFTTVGEPHNPGDHKDPRRRGYDCIHLVVDGESEDYGWITPHGGLTRYFAEMGGLEIQIRTVAAHAWAEFEHSRRYKSTSYESISDEDQLTIDYLFGAAADARQALDEVFKAIDRLLAHPSAHPHADATGVPGPVAGEVDAGMDDTPGHITPVSPDSLQAILAERYPEDEAASPAGLQFACDLVEALDIRSVEQLADILGSIDHGHVRKLMATTVTVTRVRRLDDDLLAAFGEEYVQKTASIGTVEKRGERLSWRYDRLRNKVKRAAAPRS